MGKSKPELLAPAGGMRCLEAALSAGADAVYFGLRELNARRGAENFAADELPLAVELAHGRGARAYLALNIDLAERELGLAARYLELARKSKVDAVLVRDPALLAFVQFYEGIEFHFSTQVGISTSEGMAAAKEFGITRVVLARELALEEIRACASAAGVEAEVFVQGALCFSVSGRCLLSSWIGGRSGNRGLCASPCRFRWTVKGTQKTGCWMSMDDLSLNAHLQELSSAGVKALKIEGRLKSPGWVAKAVEAYRGLIGGKTPDGVEEMIRSLGDYTGRTMSDGYFKGSRKGLARASGRTSGGQQPQLRESGSAGAPDILSVEVKTSGGRIEWSMQFKGRSCSVSLPVKVIRNPSRAVPAAEAETRTRGQLQKAGISLQWADDCGEALIPRSSLNKLLDELSAFVHRSLKCAPEKIDVSPPKEVRHLLERRPGDGSPNSRCLGGPPDRIRVSLVDYLRFVKELSAFQPILTEAGAGFLDSLPGNAVVAFPAVFYEEDVGRLKQLAGCCREKGLAVEVNSWDGWHIAKGQGARMEAGPGLMVLNSVAAEFLRGKGCESVTVSYEAGREQIRDLCLNTSVPLSVYVFGRPALMISRAELPEDVAAPGTVLRDSRGFEIKVGREGGLSVFRPAEPFDISGISDPGIRCVHLVADLCASANPPAELKGLGAETRNRFNFDRRLK